MDVHVEVDCAKSGRSTCRHSSCGKKIDQGELRIGTKVGRGRLEWHHAGCWFQRDGGQRVGTDVVMRAAVAANLDKEDMDALEALCKAATAGVAGHPGGDPSRPAPRLQGTTYRGALVTNQTPKATLRSLCEQHSLPYSKGCGLYALEKREKISEQKLLVLVTYGSDTPFVVAGGTAVRHALGLSPTGAVAVSPRDLPDDCELFVQTTSPNRKLATGCNCLLTLADGQDAPAGSRLIASYVSSVAPLRAISRSTGQPVGAASSAATTTTTTTTTTAASATTAEGGGNTEEVAEKEPKTEESKTPLSGQKRKRAEPPTPAETETDAKASIDLSLALSAASSAAGSAPASAEVSTPKRAVKKQRTLFETMPGAVDPMGSSVWSEHGSMHVLNAHTGVPAPSAKIAAFDMDGTLVATKSGRKFPVGRGDWVWLYPEVPVKLRELRDKGYKIVVITNQLGIGKGRVPASDITGKISDLMRKAGVPAQALVLTQKDQFRKPNPSSWQWLAENANGGVAVDLAQSFYVGDAAGRAKGWRGPKSKRDFSCGDRQFAHNVGCAFHTPEAFFLGEAEAPFEWRSVVPWELPRGAPIVAPGGVIVGPTQPELVLMVGRPASGKSSVSRRILGDQAGYVVVNRDTLKTQSKCQKAARAALAEGKSVVIDNTNPDPKARRPYLEIGRTAGVPVRCIEMRTPRDICNHLNGYRARVTRGTDHYRKMVPNVGFAMFEKRLQWPSDLVGTPADEGFDACVRVDFAVQLAPGEDEAVFNQFQDH